MRHIRSLSALVAAIFLLTACGAGTEATPTTAQGGPTMTTQPSYPKVGHAPDYSWIAGRVTFTDREKEVLEMLVAGRSNKEIGAALGIEERTVKAHVAKLMRKVGVQNRIALSVHAITHSLVTAK